MIAKNNKDGLATALREFLLAESVKTQEEICTALEKQGYNINQTKVSRLLKDLGVVKIKNERGEVVYWLPKEAPPSELSSTIGGLIISITANEFMVIVKASPGTAQLIARIIDYCDSDGEILGTIAGDDTIFIAPKSIKDIKKVTDKIKANWSFNYTLLTKL